MPLIFLFLFFSFCLSGCQSPTLDRSPSSSQFEFDSKKVNLLKWAAKNKILFQIPDATFDDVESSAIDNSCRKLGSPAWATMVFSTLEWLSKNPTLAQKIHVVEIKAGSTPTADSTQDLDGLSYLQLTYAKNQKNVRVESQNDIPCDSKNPSFLNQPRVDTSFDYPTISQISSTLKKITSRERPERWSFNSEFLIYLADRMTIFKLTPEISFERSALGESFLVNFMNEQSKYVRESNFKTVNYWLSELSLKSHSGSYLKIFGLVRDKDLNFGMAFLPESLGLSYPFLSYKVQDGRFTYTTLSQLDKCLSELSSRYKRSLASVTSDLSTNPVNFLAPGYTCR